MRIIFKTNPLGFTDDGQIAEGSSAAVNLRFWELDKKKLAKNGIFSFVPKLSSLNSSDPIGDSISKLPTRHFRLDNVLAIMGYASVIEGDSIEKRIKLNIQRFALRNIFKFRQERIYYCIQIKDDLMAQFQSVTGSSVEYKLNHALKELWTRIKPCMNFLSGSMTKSDYEAVSWFRKNRNFMGLRQKSVCQTFKPYHDVLETYLNGRR